MKSTAKFRDNQYILSSITFKADSLKDLDFISVYFQQKKRVSYNTSDNFDIVWDILSLQNVQDPLSNNNLPYI